MLRRVQVLIIIFILIVGPAAAQAKSFSDTYGYWAEKEILRLANLGLSDGYQGKFLPKGQVTRAEFAKMAITALGLEQQAKSVAKAKAPFRDLPVSHWGNGYILVAYENNILTGYLDQTVRPDAPISRVEIAALLVRALKAQQGAFAQQTGSALPPLPFADADTIPVWARQTLAEAVQRGLISGYEDKSFRPNNSASRAEAVVLISRLISQLGAQVEYQGIVTELNRTGRSLTMQISGQKAEILIAVDAVFYRDAVKVTWKDIQQFDEVGIVLNKEGKIVFLEVINTSSGKVLQQFRQVTNSLLQPDKSNLPNNANTLHLNTSLFAETKEPDFAAHPEVSLELTKKEMKVDQLLKATGAKGEGQIIAIVDTGVDPAHPDLLYTASGKQKIVDWVDFTSDGKIVTTNKTLVKNNVIEVDNKLLRLPDGFSKSGTVHYGFWKEAEIKNESGTGLDLNGNGKTDDIYEVLVADQKSSGVYDTVIVNTDQDGDLRDETILERYFDSKQAAKITSPLDKKSIGFLLSSIQEDGNELKLGFDSNGHGTHVAGIAAGSGQINGVAPGAQLMVLKAVNGTGQADWKTIAEAVNYAANHGAKIVNLSLGIPAPTSSGDNGANWLLQILSDVHGVIFVVAAGNSGPGLTTMTTPADTDGVISVGAYISPAMWKQDYKWDVAKDSLWYFSSMGPRFDGAMMPQLLAPGSAVSSSSRGSYQLAEGTSMAAPHVAGAVALLLENAKRNHLAYTPAKIRRALAMGAKPLEGYTEVEQGYGKIDVSAAWQQLQKITDEPLFLTKVYNSWLESGKGLYARDFIPGKLDFEIQSLSNKDTLLNLTTSQSWFKPQQDKLIIPELGNRQVRVDFQLPKEPGLYTGRLVGQIAGMYGSAVEILNTIINPYRLESENKYQLNIPQVIPAGQFKRYFIQVPNGVENLQVALKVEQGSEQFLGRARLHLYNPRGQEIDQDLFDFAGVSIDQPAEMVGKKVARPMSGTWEVVVYSSATLSEFGLYESRTNLSVEATEPTLAENDGNSSNSNYLVGINEGSYLSKNRSEYVTFTVRSKVNLQPYEGVMEINDRLFSVKQGKVVVRVSDLVGDIAWFDPINWVIALPPS